MRVLRLGSMLVKSIGSEGAREGKGAYYQGENAMLTPRCESRIPTLEKTRPAQMLAINELR
jgi:hypothetical protein